MTSNQPLPPDVAQVRAISTTRLTLIAGVALAFLTGALGAMLIMSTPHDAPGRMALWLPSLGLLGSLVIALFGVLLLFAPEAIAGLERHRRLLNITWRVGAVFIVIALAALLITTPSSWLIALLGAVIAAHPVAAAYVLASRTARRLDARPLGHRDRLAEF
ncbi:hypothetical protein BSZ39_11495 [Bowdeniella nasicola]|uniref:Uncharacterized protein n=1 Tax=Bowdeniella nasicola TaxID=208480 RepID=A0A1Q5PZK3_9ACTO|nr:hypothetical protein [Bowdeniella nasicola]OKL53058.1 hypothetical protein BSZ39_11495 [Bowdeniella nasicola]